VGAWGSGFWVPGFVALTLPLSHALTAFRARWATWSRRGRGGACPRPDGGAHKGRPYRLPHRHFHLQNAAVFQDGTGFAPYFQKVRLTRGGKTTVEAEWTPLKDDRVRPE